MREEVYTQPYIERFGARAAFAFWKGRVAIYTLLKAMGVGEGDEVLLTGYTCVMDVNPIMYLGAKPVYVDIEPETFNMRPELIEERITPRTKAIIAQHTYGFLVDMDPVMDIANRHGIPVMEDCCLALGSRYKDRLAGTMGVTACFSSQWNKIYTTGLGGVAICHDDELVRRMEEIRAEQMVPAPLKRQAFLAVQLFVYRGFIYPRTTAAAQTLFRWLTRRGLVVGSSSTSELSGPSMEDDFVMGMSGLQLRSGVKQLRRLEQNLAHRRRMKTVYDELLSERGWKTPRIPPDTDPVLVRYPVRITDKWGAVEAAARQGVELGTWFESPLHPRETRVEHYHYHWGLCPEAEKAANEVVNLPMHPRASERTARRTVDFITRYEQAE